MPCFHPNRAERRLDGTVRVKNRNQGSPLENWEFLLPCGQCSGCRDQKSRDWAVRCVHESNMQKENGYQSAFITLTYDDRNLPQEYINPRTGQYYGPGTLNPNDHVEFVNKLRMRLYRKGMSFRYYMCGEYGDKLSRPHYHYLIFGYGFPDQYAWTRHNGVQYYRSPELESIWRYGNSLVGECNVESAAYTAAYVFKKQNGQKVLSGHYTQEDGTELLPEFARMSRRPGIGASWFAKYGKQDVYDSGDFIVINGKKFSTPRYYDTLMSELDEQFMSGIKDERMLSAVAHESNNTVERLAVRQEVHNLKQKRRQRGYENGTTDEGRKIIDGGSL